MRSTIVTCDKYKQPIEADGSTLDAPHGWLHRDRVAPWDLCQACARRFLEWMHGADDDDGRADHD